MFKITGRELIVVLTMLCAAIAVTAQQFPDEPTAPISQKLIEKQQITKTGPGPRFHNKCVYIFNKKEYNVDIYANVDMSFQLVGRECDKIYAEKMSKFFQET